MIEYETYCQIRRLVESGLSYGQVSRELNLDPETVGKYAQMNVWGVSPMSGSEDISRGDLGSRIEYF
jgi:orotate phosphoribosyltransferase-like protein